MHSDFRRGFLANLPITPSVIAYAGVLGMLASQRQIHWLELVAMNVLMFAGSAQFVLVDLWYHPLPVIELSVAVLIINFRYFLITASLSQLFKGTSFLHKALTIHLVADENWAVTMAEQRKRQLSTWFLLGGGICLILAWSFGTLTAFNLGAFIKKPEKYALDFAFFAVFTAFCAGLWRGRQDLFPWLYAAAAAFLAKKFFPGNWYIIIGGFAGALAATLIGYLRENR